MRPPLFSFIIACAAVFCVAFFLPDATASASDEKNHAQNELLLTVAPAGTGENRDAYLRDVASSADAEVVKVYTALSGENDPILLLIRSPLRNVEEMMELLSKDERVLSTTPNYVRRLIRAPATNS